MATTDRAAFAVLGTGSTWSVRLASPRAVGICDQGRKLPALPWSSATDDLGGAESRLTETEPPWYSACAGRRKHTRRPAGGPSLAWTPSRCAQLRWRNHGRRAGNPRRTVDVLRVRAQPQSTGHHDAGVAIAAAGLCLARAGMGRHRREHAESGSCVWLWRWITLSLPENQSDPGLLRRGCITFLGST